MYNSNKINKNISAHPIRIKADKYFDKTFLDSVLPNSELYEQFFTTQNFQFIVNTVEQRYKLNLTESYLHDVLDTMFICFEYHPSSLLLLNNLVITELRPKFTNLQYDQNSYTNNTYDNATTAFLTYFDLPQLVTPRKESLSFAEALFGPEKKNIDYFKNLPK
jgi:hypothetical protein